MSAQVYVDGYGNLHKRNIEMILHDNGFVISQGESIDAHQDIWVESEDQARDLITAIKAMCAAHGWNVKDDVS